MSGDKNVPDIRFKGFSGEWVSFPLDGISDVLDGDRGHNYPNGDDLKNQGHTLFLSASNVTKNGFKFDTRQYITQDKSDSLGNGKLIPDDIILTTRGSIGHVAWYNENVNRAVPFARINSGMLILRAKSHIAPSVISQYLKSPMGKKKIEGISFGSAQPQLTKASVSKYLVSIPSEKPEQTQIGNTFQKLDSLINQHQQKHDKLSIIKKAMLEKMFPKQGETTPEIRFKGFSGDWEEATLGEASEITTGKLDANAMKTTGKYDFYTSGIKKYKIDIPAFEGPAITIAGNGATVGYMHLADGKFNAYQRTYVLTNFKANRYFLFCNVGKALPLKISQEVRAGNIPYIVLDMLTDLEVKLPPKKEEQTAIGNYFQKLDALINQHQQQITKLNNIKQACLSKMFV
jgi:type I restriction enzyme, S subunit